MRISFLFIFIFVLLLLLVFPSFADSGFPDMKDHWAENSVSVLSEKGIISGRGDGFFHPEERVLINEYIKMVVTALGYTDIENYPGDWARNYIEKAIELGLISKDEIKDYNQPINRGKMAQIAMRALQNEETPDYIMAYKGLLTDYNNLDANIRLDALKCVEKGIIKGMPDGSFRPEYYSTRAEAATVIHRMISEEEREKAKPIFAEPDPEFEAFMATEEAEEYCSVEFIDKVVDGKVIFKDYNEQNTGQLLAPNYHNEEVNKQIYELLRDYVNIAKESGRYVRTFYSSIGGATFISFYEDSLYGKGPNSHIMSNIEFVFNSKPYKYFFDKQNEKTYYTIKVGNLAIQGTDWASYNYREPEMTETLKTGFKVVYGEDLGQRMFDFAIEEYDKERDQWFNHDNKDYKSFFIEYREDLNNLEICYDDGLICTNK